MAHKICPGCGTKREDPAAPCPTCGYAKIPDFSKKVLQFAVLFAILGALWLAFLLKDSWMGSDTPTPNASPETHGRNIE